VCRIYNFYNLRTTLSIGGKAGQRIASIWLGMKNMPRMRKGGWGRNRTADTWIFRPAQTNCQGREGVPREMERNALRHSFGSYRMELTKNEGQVALEMGNSPKVVKDHYFEIVDERAGREHRSIKPLPRRNRKIIAFA
jgi:hypothetical protein